MEQISVAEAAGLLDVDVSRIRQRIADGSLAAEKVGHQWVIDAATVKQLDYKGAGRPLSSRSAWALAWVALREIPDDSPDSRDSGSRGCDASDALLLGPVERSRGRARLRQLLRQVRDLEDSPDDDHQAEAVAALARLLLRNRARRLLLRCSPRDLDDLRRDDRLTLAGISSASAGIASGDIVEAYVRADDIDHLVEEFLLVDADRDSANVVLHVVDADRLQLSAPANNWLLLAADLAEYYRPRETVRAAQLLHAAARLGPPAAAAADDNE